jgi:4-amino-4-deoxy-L-arabinose transferase-like glycosyltransferase
MTEATGAGLGKSAHAAHLSPEPAAESHLRSWAWLLGILAVFLVTQSVFFSHRWVIDESWYLMPIPSILEEGSFRIPTIPGDDVFWPQPPLLTYAEAMLEWVHPLSVAGARLIPLAAGCALIILTFQLGSRLHGQRVGLVAAGLVASDNLVFLAARTVRPEILVALAVVATLLVIASGTDRRHLAIAGLCAGIGISCHPNGFLAPGCALLLLLGRAGYGRRGVAKGIELALWTLLALVPLVAWMVVNDGPNDFEGFKSHWIGRYGRQAEVDTTLIGSALALVQSEMDRRWAAFVQFPFRVHIALLSILAIARALAVRDPVVRALGAGCLLQLGFFVFVNNSNSSVRYMTPLIPLVCLVSAQWACSLWAASTRALADPRRLAALAIVVGLGLSQVAGNGVYLWRARNADHPATAAALNALIPAGSRVYGSIIFWMGLRNHHYVPYMRMPWKRAVAEHDPNVVIMDDWLMADPDRRWTELRQELYEYLDAHGATLLGEVDGGYYGKHMKVYSLQPSSGSR